MLWSLLIKVRANFKSELSGEKGILNSHHMVGKVTYLLRYLTTNGICLTVGEHRFGVHSFDRHEIYRDKIINAVGEERFSELRKYLYFRDDTARKDNTEWLLQKRRELARELKDQLSHMKKNRNVLSALQKLHSIDLK
jgi:hypothetical protein